MVHGTHQIMAHADNVNLLGENVHTVKKNTKSLLIASREIGLEVDAEKVYVHIS